MNNINIGRFKKVIKKSWMILLFLIVIFYAYQDLPQTFFQQDEWQEFGTIIHSYSVQGASVLKNILPGGQALSHFAPLTSLFFRLQYLLFNLNFPPYALVSIISHLINVVLFYYFTYLLLKDSNLALVSSLFFAVNSNSHQAVSWMAASAGLLQSVAFALLVLIYFPKEVTIWWLFFIISLLFKENPFFLILLLPFYWFIFNKKRSLVSFKKKFLPLTFILLIYLLLRLFFVFNKLYSPQPEIIDVTSPPVFAYFYRFLSIPLRALTQSIVPARLIIKLAERLVFLAYPQFITPDRLANPYVAQTIVADLISYLFACLFLIIIFFVYRYLNKVKRHELKSALIFSLAFILMSSLPYILIPGRAGYFSIFEPRNIYFLGIGSSLMLSIFLYSLASLISRKLKLANFLAVILLITLLFFHIESVRTDLKNLKIISQLRKSFLVNIKTDYPQLPKKIVFYTSSDRPYYGLPVEEKILPVQTGFGRMLLVWYQKSEKFPNCLYEKQFLVPLTSQGYRFCQERGFGYFRDKEKMLEAMQQNNLNEENIIAFDWKGKEEKFTDITSRVRQEIHFLLISSRPSK